MTPPLQPHNSFQNFINLKEKSKQTKIEKQTNKKQQNQLPNINRKNIGRRKICV
jgi:hypothetical protein